LLARLLGCISNMRHEKQQCSACKNSLLLEKLHYFDDLCCHATEKKIACSIPTSS